MLRSFCLIKISILYILYYSNLYYLTRETFISKYPTFYSGIFSIQGHWSPKRLYFLYGLMKDIMGTAVSYLHLPPKWTGGSYWLYHPYSGMCFIFSLTQFCPTFSSALSSPISQEVPHTKKSLTAPGPQEIKINGGYKRSARKQLWLWEDDRELKVYWGHWRWEAVDPACRGRGRRLSREPCRNKQESENQRETATQWLRAGNLQGQNIFREESKMAVDSGGAVSSLEPRR